MIRLVADQDLNSWLELAGEAKLLFGEMVDNEDFIKGIKNCIANSSAFCAVNINDDIEGISTNERLWSN